MGWQKEFSLEFERDELRRLISYVNWFTFKPKFKEQLVLLLTQLSEKNINLNVIDMADEPDGYGFDCITLQVSDRMTGNMRQQITKESIKFNHHRQKGASLSITYSATGAVHMMLFPSSSEDSMAEHDSLIIFHSYNAKNITPTIIENGVRDLLRYHRVTGVLHKSSIKDMLRIKLLRVKTYFIQYNDKENKFKRLTALYIPALTLFVTLLATIATILTMKITMQL
ncbi:hypothetical protein [Dryocola clanedunensis]|uniref:hypothetical protein n=1 Tax=Cedecea sulfonylureivorans TaxID=3051154 RepID=UPI001F46A438|nr:hypothetical protein [Cedecea sulfonylureivorans]